MTTMPAEIEYGYVTARIILAAGDSGDADRIPDAVPAAGTTIKITPKTQIVRLTGAQPVLIAKQSISCTVDEDGNLIDPQGAVGVWLVTGVYGVAYSSPAASIPAHDIEVTSAHTESAPLDLVTAMPPGGPVLTASQYAELSARIDNLAVGAVSWDAIPDKPATFPPDAHTHTEADITDLGDYATSADLTTGLAGKADTGHTHPVTDLDTTGTADATTVLHGDGSWQVAATGGGGGGIQFPIPGSASEPSTGQFWHGPVKGGTMNVDLGSYTYYLLMPITAPATLTALQCSVDTAGIAGTTVQMALYEMGDGPFWGAPRVYLSAALDASTTGTKEETGLSVALTPGWYAFAIYATNACRVAAPDPAHRDLLNFFIPKRVSNRRGFYRDTGAPGATATHDGWNQSPDPPWFNFQIA